MLTLTVSTDHAQGSRYQMKEAKRIKLTDITPANKNANSGTARGTQMLEDSLRDYGAGRSILVDKNGRIIAGNKTYEGAGAIGMDKALIVETDGTQLVVVKRTDIDLDSEAGRGLAIADNRVSEVNLEWDTAQLNEIMETGDIDLGEWWTKPELERLDKESEDALEEAESKEALPDEPSENSKGSAYLVVIRCDDDEEQERVFEQIKELGLGSKSCLRWED